MIDYTETLHAFNANVRGIREKARGLNQGGLDLAIKYELMAARDVLRYNLMNIKEMVYFS